MSKTYRRNEDERPRRDRRDPRDRQREEAQRRRHWALEPTRFEERDE